jgi:hypothetical protein
MFTKVLCKNDLTKFILSAIVIFIGMLPGIKNVHYFK